MQVCPNFESPDQDPIHNRIFSDVQVGSGKSTIMEMQMGYDLQGRFS